MTEIVTVTSRLHGERTFHLVEMQPYRRMDGTETTVRGWQATLLPESTLSALCQLWPAADIPSEMLTAAMCQNPT